MNFPLKKKKHYLFIYYFWWHYVFIVAYRISLVATSGDYFPGVVHGLFTAVASLVNHGP